MRVINQLTREEIMQKLTFEQVQSVSGGLFAAGAECIGSTILTAASDGIWLLVGGALVEAGSCFEFGEELAGKPG